LIAANVARVRAETRAGLPTRAGRDRRQRCRLIAVTKSQDHGVLQTLSDCGIHEYGENRIDHLRTMSEQAPPHSLFHAIGRVQGRQLAQVASLCAALHSLCEEDHILRLERACSAIGKRLPVFLQVNVADDQDKSGVAMADLPMRLETARAQPHLEVLGLMTMAPLVDGKSTGDSARRCFAALRDAARVHGLPRLSMGMSEDMAIAVEEGATDVRIGRSLFA
jgi:pyridoxal phosphate enzyme (YggS family)